MSKPYSAPRLRPLSRSELTPEQIAWVDRVTWQRTRWTAPQIGGAVVAAVLAIGTTLLAIFAASMLAGCGAAEVFYVDERFSAEERAEIQAAADYWDRASGGAMHVDLVFGATVNFGRASHEGARVLIRATEAEAMRSAHPTLHDRTRFATRWLEYGDFGVRDGEGIAVIPSRLPARFPLRVIVAHELGHHFDAAHSADPSALLAADVQWTALRYLDAGCLSAADVAEVCNAADCSLVRRCDP